MTVRRRGDFGCFDAADPYNGGVNRMKAMQVMSALAQPVRMQVFRRLVATPEGIAAGDLSSGLKVAPSAMSAHLAILSRGGLVSSAKVGRNVIYRARPKAVDALVAFLTELRGGGDDAGDVAPDSSGTV